MHLRSPFSLLATLQRHNLIGFQHSNLVARLTRRVIDPETMPIPAPFQTPLYRPPLSLAFRSHAPSAAPSASDWNDIDSALFQ